MSLQDHRPHIPWGGVVGLIRRHHDEDDTPTVEITDTSIREWLASGDRRPAAAELPPLPVRAALPVARAVNTGPDDVAGVRFMPFTIHAELDDDEALTARLLEMERRTQSLADTLAAENDTRMELLLASSERALHVSAMRVRWVDELFNAITFRRRRSQIAPLVPALAPLLESGDVSHETAARIMSLRSQYLSSDQDSQRLPKLTPELLAAMDAERAA